jgi:hypothetical protein
MVPQMADVARQLEAKRQKLAELKQQRQVISRSFFYHSLMYITYQSSS